MEAPNSAYQDSDDADVKDAQEQAKMNSMSFSKALSYIYQEYANYQGEKELWTLERCEYQARIAMLEGELQSMRSLNLDLISRVKMLEYALKKERKLIDSDASTTIHDPGDVSKLSQMLSESSAKMDLEPAKSSTDILRKYIMEVTRSENFVNLQKQLYHLKKPIKSLFTLYPNESHSILPTEADENSDCENSIIRNNQSEDIARGESPAEQVRRYVQIYKNEVTGKRQRVTKNSDDVEQLQDSTDAVTSALEPTSVDNGNEVISSFDFLSGYESSDDNGKAPTSESAETEAEEHIEKTEITIPATFLAKLSSKKGSGGVGRVNVPKPLVARDSKLVKSDFESQPNSESTIKNNDFQHSNPTNLKEYVMFIMAKCHTDSVRAIGFNYSVCYPVLATGSDDRTVTLWNAQSSYTHKNPKPLTILHGHTEEVLNLTFLPSSNQDQPRNNHQLCTSSKGGSIIWWTVSLTGTKHVPSLNDYQQTAVVLSGHDEAVWSLSTVFDNSYQNSPILLSCSADGACCLWTGFGKNKPEPKKIDILSTVNTQVGFSSVKFCNYDPKKFAASFEETLYLWDVENQKQISELNLHNKAHDNSQAISCISTHHSEPIILVGWDERLLQVIDVRSGKSVADVPVDHSIVTSLAYNHSSERFASTHSDGYTMVWDSRTHRSIQCICTHNIKYDEGAISCAFHPSLDILAVSGADDIVKVFC